jgi:hypothetical protein
MKTDALALIVVKILFLFRRAGRGETKQKKIATDSRISSKKKMTSFRMSFHTLNFIKLMR